MYGAPLDVVRVMCIDWQLEQGVGCWYFRRRRTLLTSATGLAAEVRCRRQVMRSPQADNRAEGQSGICAVASRDCGLDVPFRQPGEVRVWLGATAAL